MKIWKSCIRKRFENQCMKLIMKMDCIRMCADSNENDIITWGGRLRVVSKKIEKKGLTAAVTGRAGINYHLCSRQQRTQNSKWRIRRKTRDWSPSCSADWRKYKTDMTLPLQWRTMKIENARTIENRTYSTSPGQKTVRYTIQPEESLGFTRGNT